MNNKYVIVKSYYGLGGDISVMLGAWKLSQELNRELIVHWDGGLYGEGSYVPLFNELFDYPISKKITDINKDIKSVFPEIWEPYVFSPPLTYVSGVNLTYSRPEDVPRDTSSDAIVITRDSAEIRRNPEVFYELSKKLKLNSKIDKKIEEITKDFSTYKATIGIHFRHGNGENKVIPPDPLFFRNKINSFLKDKQLEPKDVLIVIGTDCKAVVDYLSRYYPNVLDTPKNYLENGSGALHIKRIDLSNEEKINLSIEALIDMYILSKTTYFIGSGGFFSLFIKMLRTNKSNIFYTGNRNFDKYKFDLNYYPIEKEIIISKYLKEKGHPLDGLFVKIDNDKKSIYYYDDYIYSFNLQVDKISSQIGLELRKAIVARRLY